MSYKLSEIIGKNYVIHCPSIELETEILDILYDSGRRWYPRDIKPLKSNWDTYGENYCINPNDSTLMYGSFSWYKDHRYIIISAEDFIRDNTIGKPKTFKVNGTPNLIKALISELKEFGYTFHEEGDGRTYTSINNNRHRDHIKSAGDFGDMFISHRRHESDDRSVDIVFHLPIQYNEVLEYAKNAINSPYWKEAQKITIGDYTAEKTNEGVAFGCQRFTKDQLKAYQSLLSRKEFNASIKVNDVEITKEMLTKLINL